MPDLVGNPENQFSGVKAGMDVETFNGIPDFFKMQMEHGDHIGFRSCIMRKPIFCENKGTDQHGSNCEPHKRLCFHYTDGTILLLSKFF